MRFLFPYLFYLFSRAQRRDWEGIKDRYMVSHGLFWRILRLHSHGQVIVAYRPNPVLTEGLVGYFAIIVIIPNPNESEEFKSWPLLETVSNSQQ